MNIRKDRLDMYKAIYKALSSRLNKILTEEQRIILHLYLVENRGLQDIAEQMHFTDYHIVKEELQNIEARILSFG